MAANEAHRERDEMTCRSCERLERASEGYPCARCGTFICLTCELRGISQCRRCAALPGGTAPAAPRLV